MSITVHVKRLRSTESGTIGVFHCSDGGPMGFTCEDMERPSKVYGRTAIPTGRYPLRWREGGRWAARFRKMGFPGSLEICDVPEFSDVLIHIGNSSTDTEGCILPGMGADLDLMTVTKSRIACQRLYKHLAVSGGEWFLEVQ